MNSTLRITIIIAALVLLAVGLGCTDNPALRLRYEAEKKLFEAEKALNQARVNPREISPELLEAAAQKYAEAVEYMFNAIDSITPPDSPVEYRELQQLAFQAGNQLNGLLYSRRQWDESIDVLNRLLVHSELGPEELMVTRINLGRTLQASGKWDSALTMYTVALEDFYPPQDSRGNIIGPLFNLPAHIFGVARRVGDSVEAAYHLERAVVYYSDLSEQAADSQLRVSSCVALAGLYRETGQWEKEIAQLEKLAGLDSAASIMFRGRIADIYGLQHRDFDRAIALYDSLLSRLEPTDTVYYPDLLLRKALTRIEQKQYAEARNILVDLKQDHIRFYGRTPEAQLALARTFELENRWDRAEVEYNALIEGYRGSEEAMRALLHIAGRYEHIGRKDQAERWYQQAREYFGQVARYSQGGIVEARALRYQAELEETLGNWSEAAGTLEGLYRKYSRHEIGRRALLQAAAIRRVQLEEPQVADSLLAVLKAGLTEIEPAAGL